MEGQFISRMADFFSGLKTEDLDAPVAERARVCIIDAIAAAFVGYDTEPSRIGFEIAAGFPASSKSATVWVKGFQANYVYAAICNSLLVHNMIHDDMNQSHRGHAGNMVVPIALAMAEAYDRPVTDIIPAVVVGYEAMGRVAAPAVAYSVERGFRGTSTYGAFAVAATASRMLGLDAEAVRHALAAAASYSLGLLEPFNTGSMEWRFQNSVLLSGGVFAALTARHGANASPSALEGDAGFITAFCGKENREEIVAAWLKESETLGREYDISRTLFKPYSTCGYNLIGCNIALNMIQEHAITAAMLKEIVVRVSPDNKAYPGVEYHGPFETADLALLSKPFMLGAVVVTGDLQVDTYQNRLNDPEILRVAGLVRLEADESMGAMDTVISFVTKDGQVFEGDLSKARLEAFMLNWESAVNKFHGLVDPVIGQAKVQAIVDTVKNIESLKSIKELTEQLKLD